MKKVKEFFCRLGVSGEGIVTEVVSCDTPPPLYTPDEPHLVNDTDDRENNIQGGDRA